MKKYAALFVVMSSLLFLSQVIGQEENKEINMSEKISVNRMVLSSQMAVFALQSFKEEDEVKINKFQVIINQKPANLTSLGLGFHPDVTQGNFLFFTGQIWANELSFPRNPYFRIIIDPRAVKIRNFDVVYLANLTSQVFQFNSDLVGNTSWNVSIKEEDMGKYFPIYLTSDTVRGGKIEGKKGDFIGYVLISRTEFETDKIFDETNLPNPINYNNSSEGFSGEKFTGNYVKNGDKLHDVRDPYAREHLLDGRPMPDKSSEYKKRLAKKGISDYQKWYNKVVVNGSLDKKQFFLVVPYKSLEIDNYKHDIKGIKNEGGYNFYGYPLPDNVQEEKLSQSELPKFKGYVKFVIRLRTETGEGSYGMMVTVNNRFMSYHINERTQRIDDIQFPPMSGLYIDTANKLVYAYNSPSPYSYAWDEDNYLKKVFYAPSDKGGIYKGEPIGVFSFGNAARIYKDDKFTPPKETIIHFSNNAKQTKNVKQNEKQSSPVYCF